MVDRAALVAIAIVTAGCAPGFTPPWASSPPAPPPPGSPPPPPLPDRRRPDGIVYGGGAGVGVGVARASGSKVVTPGVAALGSLLVGLSVQDWVVLGLRVDASVAADDGLGDIGAHLGVFPGADGKGAIRDLQIFAEACVGGPLAQAGSTTSGSVTGLGRIGVAWERWRISTVSVGPFLAGQFARASTDAQASALAGVSLTFSGDSARTSVTPAK
jgi:hypothetical protein